MEQRVMLPYMTAEEAEIYQRYYGTTHLPVTTVTINPPSQQLQPNNNNTQFNQERRPSYPPSQKRNSGSLSHKHRAPLSSTSYGENHSEVLQAHSPQAASPAQNKVQAHSYQSTPNLDEKTMSYLPTPNPDQLKLPPNVQVSNGGNFPDPNGSKPAVKDPPAPSTFWGRLTSSNRDASRGDKPSYVRLGFRLSQIVPAFLTLIITIVTVKAYREKEISGPISTIYYFYFVSILDLCVALFQGVDFYQRLRSYRPKLKRYIPMTIDLVMLIFWTCGVIPLGVQFSPCPIDGMNGWCDRRNSLLAFGVISGILSGVQLGWDIFGTCLKPRNPSSIA